MSEAGCARITTPPVRPEVSAPRAQLHESRYVPWVTRRARNNERDRVLTTLRPDHRENKRYMYQQFRIIIFT